METPDRGRGLLQHYFGCACASCAYYATFQSSPQTPATLWEAMSPYSPQLMLWAQLASQQVAMEAQQNITAHRGQFCALACTPEGRALIQHWFATSSDATSLSGVIDELVSDFEVVAMDEHGVHTLRSIIDRADSDVRDQIAFTVEQCEAAAVLNLATSNQFTRKLLETILSWKQTPRTEDVLYSNVLFLAVKQQGCLTLNACLRVATNLRIQDVMKCVLPCLDVLCCDQYANYCMQLLATLAPTDLTPAIMKSGMGIKLLSQNKYGSNVVEKLVQRAAPAERSLIVDALVTRNHDVSDLICDPFANFVIQACLATCVSRAEHKRLCDKIRPFVAHSPYAQKIEAKMKMKRAGHCQSSIPRGTSPTMEAVVA